MTLTRLEMVRTRINNIREKLTDATLMTNVTTDGISESLDRRALQEELDKLEWQEAVLSGKITASGKRGIDLRGA